MRVFAVPACLWLAVASPVLAQDGPVSLTLRAALDAAMSRNPDLIALRRQYDATAALPAQERYLGPPSFEVQIWQWPITTLNPARTDMYMFTLQQELPGRGKRAARELVADRDADMARRQIAVHANRILDEVRQTYAELVLARDTATLYERQAPVLRDIADAATVRYASGRGEQHDTVRALVELSWLRAETIRWGERVRTAEVRLNTLLGRPVDRAVEPLVSAAATLIPPDAERIALERHPEMAMAAAAIVREEAELARLRGERRPDFMLGGGYMLTPGHAGAWTASAGLTWPNAPWSRGGVDAAIDAQIRTVQAAVARREAIASAIRRGVHEAEIRADAARQRVDLISSTVLPHVRHAFDVSRIAYATGRAGFADVVDTQRVFLGAHVEYARAQADLALAVAGLERAIGAVTEEPVPAQPGEKQL